MRFVELGLEGEDGAAGGKEADKTPVDYLQRRITYEAVVYERNVGSPHEEYDALEVELHSE